MTINTKGNVAKLATAIITTAMMLILTEVILRQIYPVPAGNSFQFRIPHKKFGWVLQPGASYFNSVDGTAVYVTYNSKGWRDTEHAFENPDNKLRILVLGDSFMEAYSVNLNDALPKKLEQVANRDGTDVEVINLGVGGYGTLQEYLVFREIGIKYKPDIVLLGFYLGNDVMNNSLVLESIINKGLLKVNSRPFLDTSNMSEWKISQVDYDGALRRYRESKEFNLTQKLKKELVLARLMLNAIRNIKDRFYKSKNNKKEPSDLYCLALFGVNYCDEHPDYTNAWNITKRILHRLDNEVSQIGSKFVVFTVPSMEEVNPNHLKNYEISKNGILCIEEAPAYQRLSGILNELDIEYVNLLPIFRDATENGQVNLFRRSDKHWNERGHDLATDYLYSALVERNLLTHRRQSQ